jgi:hypothetical protein
MRNAYRADFIFANGAAKDSLPLCMNPDECIVFIITSAFLHKASLSGDSFCPLNDGRIFTPPSWRRFRPASKNLQNETLYFSKTS